MTAFMRASLVVVSLTLCHCAQTNQSNTPPSATAQRVAGSGWQRRLPSKPGDQLTFADFKNAYEEEYAGRPVPRPDDRKAFEARNLFKQWEWFTWPRVYPSGRWENEIVFNELRGVAEFDLASLSGMSGMFGTPPPVWRLYGPSDVVGSEGVGRVNAIVFEPGNPNVIYVGAADGGLWKSSNGGATWVPLTDTLLPTLSIADIAIDPTDINHIYVATGDGYGRDNPFWGGTYSMGVWVTNDGGSHWQHVGPSPITLGQKQTIRRLVMHPTNPKVLMAATSAGLFRTENAGTSWTQLSTVPTFDVEFDPTSPDAAYATTTQFQKWTFPATGVQPVIPAGSPTCWDFRFSVEVAASNPAVVYTLCSNGTLRRSPDGGNTWGSAVNTGADLYGIYGTVLAVSPSDPDVVIVAGYDMKKTPDGGVTWSTVATAHVDTHCIRFYPGSSTMLLNGNDGGVWKTTSGGPPWASLNSGLAITQFYRVGVSRQNIGLLLASSQDNGNMRKSGSVWTTVSDGDGTGGFIDYTNGGVSYAEISSGWGSELRRYTGTASPAIITAPGTPAWVAPFLQDPHRGKTIYTATDRVYRNDNQGLPASWTDKSGVLSGISKFTILKVNLLNSLIMIAGSGAQPGTGLLAGKLYRTEDGGTKWTDITPGLPVAQVDLSDAAMSETNPDVIWATFSGFLAGQKVYKWTKGSGWKNMSSGLPNIPVNCVAAEMKAGNPIYVGTDAGVYYFRDGFSHFVPFKAGLPNVIVDELEIHYLSKKIFAATYGRGLWFTSLVP